MAAPTNATQTPQAPDPTLVRQIRQASQASDSDFGLLMAQAAQESGFRADAKSPSSSAAGLFQFIESTWLDMVHRFGAKYGLGDLAQKIGLDPQGRPQVADAATRRRILALRSDPKLSAALAGEYSKLNEAEVERALGHKAGRADLYMAHFLGAGGATVFLKALETKGTTPAAQLLPEAAASNRSIFFESDTGRARSVAEIYRALGRRIEQEAQAYAGDAGAPDPADAPPAAIADAADGPAPSAAAPRRLDLAGLQLSQQVAGMLDTLTLAALKLAAQARRTDKPG
ncbi:MAG TPA: transglycosylase SLT domain-containing protein [Stellaceae bacterium]|nr:transglycosylase SLT domain-containing protein [Stellaceae bacterium]